MKLRNKEISRRVILGRLKIYGQTGETAAVILAGSRWKALSNGGPWSEDLQDLINEGLVESLGPTSKLSMHSKVRIAKSN